MGRAIGTQVVFVRSELTTLGGDSLELLLSWGVGVSDVHYDGAIHIRLDLVVVELRDDDITDVAALEARPWVRIASSKMENEENGNRQHTGQNRPRGCCPCYLAGSCSTEWYNQQRWTQAPVGWYQSMLARGRGQVMWSPTRSFGALTISFICLGRFEMYRLVDASSPSAFRRELKDSCETTSVIMHERYVLDRASWNTYTSESNLVPEIVETPDALFGVTDITELGKTKSEVASVQAQPEST